MYSVDAVVIGAGMVGLACARQLAIAGLETLILEAESAIGLGISSRNSEVIHAGIYYRPGSNKARFCVAGRELLYSYCDKRSVPYSKIGKLIVAANPPETSVLERLLETAQRNGVYDLRWLNAAEVAKMEPALRCCAALLSPSTGIVDSHTLMHTMLGDFEAAGGTLALRTRVHRITPTKDGVVVEIDDDDVTQLQARYLVNASGLNAPDLCTALPATQLKLERRFAKGSYLAYRGKVPFRHLIYPVPEPGGLGVHLTFDLAGQARFGPDVEWIETPDYQVSEEKAPCFANAVRRYWPDCDAERLAPAYAGVRPKIMLDGQIFDDFLLMDSSLHGVENVVDLCGIESPGLTSALAIAEEVVSRLNLQ